jgi:hypothetical protein
MPLTMHTSRFAGGVVDFASAVMANGERQVTLRVACVQ